MEYWMQAKLYLIGYSKCVEVVVNYEKLVRKYSNVFNANFQKKELSELNQMNLEISKIVYEWHCHRRCMPSDYIVDDKKFHESVKLIKQLIREKTPKQIHISKKEKRIERAKLNRSYGRGKNK